MACGEGTDRKVKESQSVSGNNLVIDSMVHRGHMAWQWIVLLALIAVLVVVSHRGFALSPWPLSSEDAATLRQVVLVHRHGARFPTKPTGKADIAWPIRTQFWESYKGHLTPVGCSQLQDPFLVKPRFKMIQRGLEIFLRRDRDTKGETPQTVCKLE